MNYSLRAFKCGWGKRHLNFCRLMVCLIVVPALILVAWGLLWPGTCPVILAATLGITSGLCLIIGLWLSVCVYIGAKRKSERQKIILEGGKLQLRMAPQEGWTFSFVGHISDQHFYAVKCVERYWEDKRYFYVIGEIQDQRVYNGSAWEPKIIPQLKIPKVFEGEDQLRDYLNKAKGGV